MFGKTQKKSLIFVPFLFLIINLTSKYFFLIIIHSLHVSRDIYWYTYISIKKKIWSIDKYWWQVLFFFVIFSEANFLTIFNLFPVDAYAYFNGNIRWQPSLSSSQKKHKLLPKAMIRLNKSYLLFLINIIIFIEITEIRLLSKVI